MYGIEALWQPSAGGLVNSFLKELEELADPEPVRAEPALDFFAWMSRYRAMLAVGKPLDFERHPYLVDLYQNNQRHRVIEKAAQLGVSEWAVSYAMWSCDQRKANVLYVFPSERTISDFSATRITPAINASDYLSQIVLPGNRGGVDQTMLKRIGNRHLYLRGGQVKPDGRAPQLKSIDADVVVLDELDEMDKRVPAIAEKRLGHSTLKEMVYLSTPSYPGMGIHEWFLQSDRRYWMLKCPHCGARQHLTVHHLITEWDDVGRPVGWHGKSEGVPFCACEHCGGELDRLAYGEWVAEYPGRELVGYHMDKLFSPHSELAAIIRNLDTADEDDRKEAYNQDLGLPYRPKGGGLEPEQIDACIRDYGSGPLRGEITVMGVDVGLVLHVVIRGRRNADGLRPLRYAGTVGEFEDLLPLIKRFRVRSTVVDANPETRSARAFQASQRSGRVYLAYYSRGHSGRKQEDPLEWNDKEGIVNVDRTRLLDETYARFIDEVNVLPADIKNVKDYYRQLCAPVRTTRMGSDHNLVTVYVETEADHFAHAENYCTIAGEKPLVHFGSKLPQGATRGWSAR
jgi:hypothetical protein